MTNEEKAKEIAESCYSKRTKDKPANKLGQAIIMQACLETAEWKKQQMMEKVKDYIYKSLHSGLIDCTNIDLFFEGIKQAMKD